MLVKISDQRVPPTNQPAAGIAKERQARLLDEPVVVRPLVRLDPNSPLAVDPGFVTRGHRGGWTRLIVAARRRDERGQRKKKPRQ